MERVVKASETKRKVLFYKTLIRFIQLCL